MEEDEELEVFIMPSDSSDGYQQGMDIDSFNVGIGEKFRIDSDYVGWVENDDSKYKLVKKNSRGGFDTLDDTDHLDLEPGNYLFHNDGETIEQR
jgi:hypothetical protein